MSSDVTVKTTELEEFVFALLIKIGLSKKSAKVVSESLIEANIRGVDSHGIVRLPFYIQRLSQGGTNLSPNMKIVKDGISTALVDADFGMGQVAGALAMELAIKKAENTGIGMVGVKNSEHFGAASYYTMMAVRENMIGISWSNGTPNMAPWGGSVAAIANQPLSIAAPTAGSPLILDMAMSWVSGGKVRLAAKKGESIPENWIINKNGFPTSDPNDIVEGALLPLGYKGYGLAVMGEVLNSVLTGAGILSEVSNWLFSPDKHTHTGHVMIAININHFLGIEEFKYRINQMINELKNTKKIQGVEEIFVPGEIEEKIALLNKQVLHIPEAVYHDLEKLSIEFNMEFSL